MVNIIRSALVGAALSAGIVWGGAAYAATIPVSNSTDLVERGQVKCDACVVLLSEAPVEFSFDEGRLFNVGSSAQAEADWVSSITGLSFTKDDAEAGKTELGMGDNGDDFTFSTDALFILLKIGREPATTLVRNDSGGLLEINWMAVSGTGGGLSHFTEFGVAPIPLPAAGFLLIGALGGLGFAARRRRRTA